MSDIHTGLITKVPSPQLIPLKLPGLCTKESVFTGPSRCLPCTPWATETVIHHALATLTGLCWILAGSLTITTQYTPHRTVSLMLVLTPLLLAARDIKEDNLHFAPSLVY